jgi:hypothetical protein
MILAFFSETYSADTPSASMAKLAPVARAAEQAGYVRLYDPGSITGTSYASFMIPLT